MRHIMLDIETLGTKPGCAVLSACLMEFDPYILLKSDIIPKQEGHILVNIDLLTQLFDGFNIEDRTLSWWKEQDVKAKNAAANLSYKGPCDALYIIRDFIHPVLSKSDVPAPIKIWAKSPEFDCNILERMFEFYEIECPWTFRDKADVRTIVSTALPFVYHEIGAPSMPVPGVSHDPMHDCMQQIRDVQQAIRGIKHGTA